MKTLYKHVHLVIDDRREYLDGSILIDNDTIEDVFVQSNKTFDDVKEIDMQGKIFIPCFFDSKSKSNEQKGIIKKYICSDKPLNKPTHLVTDKIITNEKNICAVTRINDYHKENGIKTFINPLSEKNIFADGVSDITEASSLIFNSNKMINYALTNKCVIEFGIDNNISDGYINFVFRNIDIQNIMLISYNHDDIINQAKRLYSIKVPLVDIVAMTSINPYRFYGFNNQEGYLIKGKQANIVCLNDRFDIEFVLVGGEKYA